MKKIMLARCSGVEKTTLARATKGREITYHKTQYISNYDVITDTSGEYAGNRTLVGALILYSYKTGIVGLLTNAIEDYSLYSPNIVSMATREVIGVVTQIDQPEARSDLAAMQLEFTGCRKVLYVNSVTDEGAGDILNCLRGEGDAMPREREEETDEANSDAGG